jgi:predicted RNA-binding protein YlqC (UPF0109 family)
MKDLIDYIARSLVDDASAVQVAELRDRSTRMKVYRLAVAQGETGRVIGKEGKIANAIRVLLRAAAAKSGEHVTLKIM